MHFLQRFWAWILGVVVIAALVAGAWYYYARIYVPPFPIAAGDTISSWSFTGAYAGNATLITNANADIAHLTGLLGKGQYDNYDLYIGIGNDYTMLGNGAAAYQNYDHAIAISKKFGLAYINLGNLMVQLKAYNTAKAAYAAGVAAEPGMLGYHLTRLSFLTTQFPNDTQTVAQAFADASKQFGDEADILAIEAPWLAATGHIADAIRAWQTVEVLAPASHTAAIKAEIAKLQAELPKS